MATPVVCGMPVSLFFNERSKSYVVCLDQNSFPKQDHALLLNYSSNSELNILNAKITRQRGFFELNSEKILDCHTCLGFLKIATGNPISAALALTNVNRNVFDCCCWAAKYS